MQIRDYSGGKAEARIIGRITHQDDGCMAAPAGFFERVAHQGRTDALALVLAVDGKRPEQQRGAGGSRQHVPQAQRTDETPLAVQRGEGEAFGRQPALAQAFGGLAAACLAEGAVEQALARRDISSGFGPDRDHVQSHPVIPAQGAGNQRVMLVPRPQAGGDGGVR